MTYDKWQGNQRKSTHRDSLRMTIDAALRLQPDGFDALMQMLEEAGYWIKLGAHISVKPPDSDRYIRLKSLTLGYNFDTKLVKKWGLSGLRLTFNATNLLTITGYDGYDPEIGASTASANVFNLDNGRYPSPTSFTFGLNVSF